MQKKISRLFFLMLLVSVSFLMSFQQDISSPLSVEQLIDNAVEKKLKAYRIIRNKKCNTRILDEAGIRADSIVISRIKALKVIQDSISRPVAPDRPVRPELLEPIDSSAASPLLEGEELNIEQEEPEGTGGK